MMSEDVEELAQILSDRTLLKTVLKELTCDDYSVRGINQHESYFYTPRSIDQISLSKKDAERLIELLDFEGL